MNDPITPCQFNQFAERRLEQIEQYRDGIILGDTLGFVRRPAQGYVLFEGRVQCRGGLLVDVDEYLEITRFPPNGSFQRGTISLEAYKYHLVTEDGTNICRFDGPHDPKYPDQFAEASTVDHDHHEVQHVHLFDPEVEDGQTIRRTWPSQTPTLVGLLKNAHDWRHGVSADIAGYEMRVWPFDENPLRP